MRQNDGVLDDSWFLNGLRAPFENRALHRLRDVAPRRMRRHSFAGRSTGMKSFEYASLFMDSILHSPQ